MGALFSSQDDENRRLQAERERARRIQIELERRRQAQAEFERIRIQADLERRRQIEEQQFQELFQRLTIHAGTTYSLQREGQLLADQPRNLEKYKVKINTNFIEGLRPWIYASFPNHNLSHNTVNTVKLEENTTEYFYIHRHFKISNKNYIKAVQIERVDNIYLLAAYLLKKEQIRLRHGTVREKLMFHGTKSQNIQGICNDNFNWRLRGSGTGHKFGQGVSFSPVAFYATHYSDKRSSTKMMFVVNVLYSNTCIGNREMVLPIQGCDTSTNEKEHVYVKYEDNEFYPAYVIHYTNNQ